MKKNICIIYLTELLLLIYIFVFNFIISKYLINYIDVINIIFLLLLLLISYISLGFFKKNLIINKSAKQTLIICFVFYYLSTYLFGLVFGFLKSGYLLSFFNISKNILYAILFYILKEIYRYIIIKSNSNGKKLPIILLILLLAGLDIIMEINNYNFSNANSIFEFVESSVLPRIALSAFLNYLASNFNYKLSVFYLLLYELPKYFLPIFPDMGNFIECTIKLIFIFICYYKLSILLEKYERHLQTNINNSNFKYRLGLTTIMSIMFVIIGLTSGTFKYHLFAIGSNSMVPVFEKGDAVLIKKLKKEEIKKIKEDDIIAFYYNNKILVHRVVTIKENNNNYLIKTKGDNNNSIDAWTINNDDIYGEVEYIIKYIGLPSVELSELMNKEW